MNLKQYQQYTKTVAQFLESNHVKPGCHGIKYHDRGQGGEPTEDFFSKIPCECCHTPLHGKRETWVFVIDNTIEGSEPLENFEADICQDCVYYLTYGRLDDSTMMAIEGSAS